MAPGLQNYNPTRTAFIPTKLNIINELPLNRSMDKWDQPAFFGAHLEISLHCPGDVVETIRRLRSLGRSESPP